MADVPDGTMWTLTVTAEAEVIKADSAEEQGDTE